MLPGSSPRHAIREETLFGNIFPGSRRCVQLSDGLMTLLKIYLCHLLAEGARVCTCVNLHIVEFYDVTLLTGADVKTFYRGDSEKKQLASVEKELSY